MSVYSCNSTNNNLNSKNSQLINISNKNIFFKTNDTGKKIDFNSIHPVEYYPVENNFFSSFKTKGTKKYSKRLDFKHKSKQERFNEKLKKSDDVSKYWKSYRKAAGDIWIDPSMSDWPDDDYRIFVGNLGNEVTDTILRNAFLKYSSLKKVKVIRDSRNGKSKGYGFISLLDEQDYINCMNEMQGKYVGNRCVKLIRSKWKNRTIIHNKSKLLTWKFTKDSHKKLQILKNKLIENKENV